MLWKATNYNSLRREQDNLKQQFVQLQTQVKDTNQRLSSLQSLAGEVAVAYGFTRFRQNPFGLTDAPSEAEDQYQQTLDQYSYLEHNVAMVSMPVNAACVCCRRLNSPVWESFLRSGQWLGKLPDTLVSGSIRSAVKVPFIPEWTLRRASAMWFAPRPTV